MPNILPIDDTYSYLTQGVATPGSGSTAVSCLTQGLVADVSQTEPVGYTPLKVYQTDGSVQSVPLSGDSITLGGQSYVFQSASDLAAQKRSDNALDSIQFYSKDPNSPVTVPGGPPDFLSPDFYASASGGSLASAVPYLSGNGLKSPTLTRSISGQTDEGYTLSYSGTDMRVLVDVNGNYGRRQLLELTTITVSVHREKAPVRACSYINPKGFARGRRTIAGTLILTQFTVDWLYQFLGVPWTDDLSQDSQFVKPDQLPPFNLTLLFADERGHASYQRILGVDCMTDGVVYSVNDMFSEKTISYVAADFTPLLPLSREAFLVSPTSSALKTPMQVMPNSIRQDPAGNDVVSTLSDAPASALNLGFTNDGQVA